MFGCSCRCILLLVFLHSVHSFKWISPTHLDKSYIFSSSVSLRLKASSVKISNDKPRGGPPLPPSPSSPSNVTVNVGKALTKEIMAHFGDSRGLADIKRDVLFKKRLYEAEVSGQLDGMHVMTLIFQSARSRRKIKSLMPPEIVLKTLSNWEREWSERDISTFVYGIRALECVDKAETELLRLGAKKISESSASLSSRAIGNSLYGLQDITSDTLGAAELCAALALKIEDFSGDLLGQDIGIGMYGLQGMSSDVPEVRQLVAVLAQKIKQSEIELDAQALGNTLYGLQVRLPYTASLCFSLLYFSFLFYRV